MLPVVTPGAAVWLLSCVNAFMSGQMRLSGRGETAEIAAEWTLTYTHRKRSDTTVYGLKNTLRCVCVLPVCWRRCLVRACRVPPAKPHRSQRNDFSPEKETDSFFFLST